MSTPAIKSRSLADIISIRGRFQRSVHLERDYYDAQGNGYHITPCAYAVLQLVASAYEQQSERAITLVGPYGAGKSALCVYTARLLNPRKPRNGAAHHLELVDAELAAKLLQPSRALIPVLIVGSRQSLTKTLVKGLVSALKRGGYIHLVEAITSEWAEVLASQTPTSRQVADLYKFAAEQAGLEEASGLLVIVDEMGKLLEYAALHPDTEDIFVLQEIAEVAVRSGATPLIFMGVLHQNADAYARKLGKTNQTEWAKVGERFRTHQFSPSDSEQVDLIGYAIEQREPIVYPEAYEALVNQCSEQLSLPVGLKERFADVAHAAYPLHPVTLIALPTLFRRTGQSHRSLFNFLAGHEPYALGAFLRESSFEEGDFPLLTVDRLFDYSAEVLVGGWSTSGISRLWVESIELIERTHNISPEAMQLLKCIGLFGILRDPKLPPTEEVLELALTDAHGQYPNVAEALNELQQRAVIVKSRLRGTYRLWEGGDIDVAGALEAARIGLPAGTTLHVASNLCPQASQIARRHSYQTGTLRTVQMLPCAPEELERATEKSSGSLTVLYCLATTNEEAQMVEALARLQSDANLLVAIGMETDIMREAALDVAAAARVKESTPELAGDEAARRELALRLLEAQTAFRNEWERVFSPSTGGATWFYRGSILPLEGQRHFSSQLSTMADESYPYSPRLRNELINRQVFSSAAAAGRRNLIEAMLKCASQENLGIEGYPPERSMYECILQATGLHREIQPGVWSFCAPDPADDEELAECWKAISDFVFMEPPKPRPVADLFETLRAMPYGLTEGILPILFCAFMQVHDHEATLYREGAFLTETVVADYEVLMRRPDLFTVAGCRVTGVRAMMLQRIARGLGLRAEVPLVVRELLRRLKALPPYAWKTHRVSTKAQSLRRAVERAKSPEQLLFIDLPNALKVPLSETQDSECTISNFFNALNSALQELAEALPKLLIRSRDILLDACGEPTGLAGWQKLRHTAVELLTVTADSSLLPFLNRAAMEGDDEAVIESVLALIANNPPRHWTDTDAERYPINAKAIGTLYRRAIQSNSIGLVELWKSMSQAEIEESKRLARRVLESAGHRSGSEVRIVRASLYEAIALLDHVGTAEERK